jgi:sortase A
MAVALRTRTSPPPSDGALDAWAANAGHIVQEDAPSASRRVRTTASPRMYVLRAAAIVIAVLVVGTLSNLLFFSGFAHSAAQTRVFSRLRNQLALGVAPVGSVDVNNRLLANGTPVALIQVPAIGMHEVIVEGTTAKAMEAGPGHLRTTVLPGQVGTSVVLGRLATYGGPFGRIHSLRKGDAITVTTGVGVTKFKVIDTRRAGDPVPPSLPSGGARITLVTVTGSPLLPGGLLRVDADIVGQAQAATPVGVTSVSRAEQPMGSDTRGIGELVVLLIVLNVVAAVAVWSWVNWGRAQTWIVFTPVVLLLAYYLTDQVARLLPNLL